MQIESSEWKRHEGRRGSSIFARCANKLRGAIGCTLAPLSFFTESNPPRARRVQALEGTRKSGDSIVESRRATKYELSQSALRYLRA
jgi:hypothetical protein